MKTFDLSDVLSVITGRLISKRGMEAVYEVLGFLTNDPNISTIGIYDRLDVGRSAILEQHPKLASIDTNELTKLLKADPDSEKVCDKWVGSLQVKYGNTVSLKPIKDCKARTVIDDLYTVIDIGKKQK